MSHKIVDIYVKDLRNRGTRANVIKNTNIYLNLFYDWVREQGLKDCKAITKDHIIAYRRYLMEDYISDITSKTLSNNSINARLQILTNHFAWLKFTGKRKDNPTLLKKLGMKSFQLKQDTDEEDFKYLEPPEIEEFKDYLRTTSRAEQAVLMVRLTFEEGLRIGETLALDFEDVDFENKKIKIHKTMSRNGKIERSTKSYHVRTLGQHIELSDSLMEDIRKMQEKDPKLKPIFTFKGKRLQYPACEFRMMTYNKHLTFRHKLHWHLGRHSAATNLIAAGIPVPAVQKHLGHKKIATTQRYAHAVESRKGDYGRMREAHYQNGNGKEDPEPRSDRISQLRELLGGLSKEEKLQLLSELI